MNCALYIGTSYIARIGQKKQSSTTTCRKMHLINQLFFELCPRNTDVIDLLLKESMLNDFYSTNIYLIYPVTRHICALDIDPRLKAGDITLVGDIQYVTIVDIEKNFLPFDPNLSPDFYNKDLS